MIQGSEEWAAARCGLLTASEMHLIVTPTLKAASNDKERGHLYELLAQRITQYVEPRYVSDDMLRGMDDEIDALELYSENHAKIERVGFITNDKFGFTIGYSPDALVGADGQVECKSRRAKYQVQTIVEGVTPPEYMIQLQTGLMVSERKWCDFVSYSGGLPMFVLRCYSIQKVQDAILEAATGFETRLASNLAAYSGAIKGLIPTERKTRDEVIF
jgi:tetrahydromethanopterin S-methyltransferase subunit B